MWNTLANNALGKECTGGARVTGVGALINRSVMKLTSQGQVRWVGLCSETISVFGGQGRDPTSCWHGYAVTESARTFGKSFGEF